MRSSRQVVAGVIVIVSAALLALQMLWRGHLYAVVEYDDGVYFGASLNLVHGVLPYTDYRFIQPPGIVIFLAPFAAVSSIVGSAHAWELARAATAVIAVVNVWLVGRLLWRRPVVEMAAGMAVIAVYPGALTSAQTTLIEPLLTLLGLVSLLAVLDRDRLMSSARRQRAGALLAGVAVAVKIWAVIPLAVLVVSYAIAGRRDGRRDTAPAGRLAGWGVLGFVVVTAPFAFTAPDAFVRQVVITQAIRPSGGYGWEQRVADLGGTAKVTALLFRSGDVATWVAVALTLVLVALIAVSFARPGATPITALDRIAVSSTALIAVALIVSPTYYYHYSGFIAPYLALSVAHLVAWARSGAPQLGGRNAYGRRWVIGSAGAAVALAAAADIHTIVTEPRPVHLDSASRRQLRSTGCVLYLFPGTGILADSYTAFRARCPHVVDYYGEQRVLTHGLSQTPADDSNPDVQRAMLGWMERSDMVVVANAATDWGPAVSAYVHRYFTLEALNAPTGYTIYRRLGPS